MYNYRRNLVEYGVFDDDDPDPEPDDMDYGIGGSRHQ